MWLSKNSSKKPVLFWGLAFGAVPKVIKTVKTVSDSLVFSLNPTDKSVG